MFQYATLYSVGKTTGHRSALPAPRKSENSYCRYVLDDIFSGLTIKIENPISIKYLYKEKNLRFDSSIFTIPDETDILGYFQSENYFANHAEDIRKEFFFNDKIQQKIEEKYGSYLRNEIVVSLHVRRGDYVKLQHTHPLCSVEYYQKAIEHFSNDATLMVISDDVMWCKENLSYLHKKMVFANNNADGEDLCLMSKCLGGNIIANSSFSWWGAWLANSQKVIAPRNWYGKTSSLDSTDIISERWTAL